MRKGMLCIALLVFSCSHQIQTQTYKGNVISYTETVDIEMAETAWSRINAFLIRNGERSSVNTYTIYSSKFNDPIIITREYEKHKCKIRVQTYFIAAKNNNRYSEETMKEAKYRAIYIKDMLQYMTTGYSKSMKDVTVESFE